MVGKTGGHQWNRRRFLGALAGTIGAVGGVLVIGGCGAIPPLGASRRDVPRIGYLSSSSAGNVRSAYVSAFRSGLADLGYAEGDTIEIEWRFPDERPGTTVSDLAAELVSVPVRAIVTSTTSALVAAAQSTKVIPIVSGGPSRSLTDLGLVERDARPGGNVTGTGGNLEVYTKLVELLNDSVPSTARVAYLRNPSTPGTGQQMAQARAAADQLGLTFMELQARSSADVATALGTAAAAHADGLIVSADTIFDAGSGDAPIIRLPVQYRLPTICSQVIGYVDVGGLMGYSPDFVASQRRAAAYVDKILKGANPAELPVEQAMTFQFGINVKTARDMGLTIPEQVLLQATLVIQ